MSSTHAYFLVDASALANSAAVMRVVTRILIYLAFKHDTFTWNYELIDLNTRQRAATAFRKRRISERKKLTTSTLEGFSKELCEFAHAKQQSHAAAYTGRAALDTLRERLMCLEADVEWGDPALMRSPTRTATTMRAWTDPTRLNESISVRSFLYIIGEAPATPEDVESFVDGSVGSQDTLLEKLTQMRDSIIGNGIWESYARKRVGVSWIQSSRPNQWTEQTAVDIMIGAVFNCCFEALGGCVMSVPELDATALVPFSSLFKLVHRVRTFPSWNRKFAREISAAVEWLSRYLDTSANCSQNGSRSWSLIIGNCQDSSVKLVEYKLQQRRWLTDGRIHRRYNFPEMVALAGKVRLANNSSPLLPLVHLQSYPQHNWPLVVRYLDADPVVCHAYNLNCSRRFMLAIQQLPEGEVEYAAVVPLNKSDLAAIYTMDAAVFGQVVQTLESNVYRDTVANQRPNARAFHATWLEGWVSEVKGQLNIVPVEKCDISVSIDNSLIEAFKQNMEAGLAQEPANDICERDTQTSCTVSADSEPTEKCVQSLETWYSEMYIKLMSQAAPQFDQAIATIKALLANSAHADEAYTAVAQLIDTILQSSASIEDVSVCNDKTDSENIFGAIRLRSAAALANDGQGKRRWQVHECQLQILLHLLALDFIQEWDLGERCDVSKLTEALSDLADQLCIWASVDDMFSLEPGNSVSGSAVLGYMGRSNDLAAAFVGSSVVGQFAERLSDTVEELRVQCGWVPHEENQATADNKRRKNTPRKITADKGERSEVIVHQSKCKSQTMSGRKLARHLEELIGGKKRRQHFGTSSSNDDTAKSDPSANLTVSSQRRRSTQLKLPLQLIRQLKSEVVSTARPASLSRSRTINARSSSSGSIRRGTRNNTINRTFSASKISTANNCVRSQAPARRQPIPEFPDLSSSPSISGRVDGLHLVPETPSKKRQRIQDPVPASSSPTAFVSSIPAANTFIYESDDSDGQAETLFVLSQQQQQQQQQLCQESGDAATTNYLHGQGSHRMLQFSGHKEH
ncbi:hypothetical protein H4R22_002428 [Coemansia sp. RSA 1290]|nr:hypothetical protein H4R22_002428 [Coemansia sp. RSA 1290]